MNPLRPPDTAPDDPRLGHFIGRTTPARAVLVGFPTDVGVRRNGGRPGAAEAPAEVRRWLSRLGTWDAFSDTDLSLLPPLDLGNVHPAATLEESLALWERGKGSTNKLLHDGTKVTVFLRKPALREAGILPKGGVARFYGTAKLHKSGDAYDKVWQKLVQPEKDRDPDKKGYAVLIAVERTEDLAGQPLNLA